MSPKLPRITAKEMAGALERDGWFFVRQQGSHRIYAHSTKTGTIPIPFHHGEDLGVGLIRKILRDARLTPGDFRRLL